MTPQQLRQLIQLIFALEALKGAIGAQWGQPQEDGLQAFKDLLIANL